MQIKAYYDGSGLHFGFHHEIAGLFRLSCFKFVTLLNAHSLFTLHTSGKGRISPSFFAINGFLLNNALLLRLEQGGIIHMEEVSLWA